MSSLINYKNIFMYNFNDNFSKEFLYELEKYPAMKKNFVLICLNDPNLIIPEDFLVMAREVTPILILNGIGNAIKGNNALIWIKNIGLNPTASKGINLVDNASELIDENKLTRYNQQHNINYNRGYNSVNSNINSKYSDSKQNYHITTYDDINPKEDLTKKIDKKLNQFKLLRKNEDEDFKKSSTKSTQPTQSHLDLNPKDTKSCPKYNPIISVPQMPFKINNNNTWK